MRCLRFSVGIIGYLLLLVAVLGVGAHFVGITSTAVAWVASFTPVAVISSVGALALLLAGGRRWASVAAAVVVVVGVAGQVPLYVGRSHDHAADESITVMQANIRLGSADPQALVESARRLDADLLTVIELTATAADGLRAAGIGTMLPYACERPRGGGGGAGIFSRYPLTDCEELDGFVLNNLRAVADLPDVGRTAVYALHPIPPYPEPAYKWVFELKKLRPLFEAERLPMVVGADFNSTWDHKQFRELLANANPPGSLPLVDAAEYVGAGVVATFPADSAVPALLAIDRILVRGFEPLSYGRFDLPGSDHHGVVGRLGLV